MIRLTFFIAICCSILFISGCSEAPVTGAASSDGSDMIAPQQTQQALQQLRSPRPQDQLGGLIFLERFPSVAQSQVEQIELLSNTGASASVKKKATELLTKLESHAEASTK